MTIIIENFPLLLAGLGRTLFMAAAAYLGALILGTTVAVLRVSPVPILRGFSTVYVEFFRNIPLLTLMILTVFALPDAGIRLSFTAGATIAIIFFVFGVCLRNNPLGNQYCFSWTVRSCASSRNDDESATALCNPPASVHQHDSAPRERVYRNRHWYFACFCGGRCRADEHHPTAQSGLR